MKEANKIKALIGSLFLATFVAGCGGGDGNDFEGANCGGVHPVESSFQASLVAGDIAQAVEQATFQLPNGSYVNRVITGSSGSISLTGTIFFSGTVSCGFDCIQSFANDNVTAVLSNYSVNSGDARVSGTVNYSNTTGSRQSGLTFSTFGSVSFSDNGGSISYDGTDSDPLCNPLVNGTQDTIFSISSSGSSSSSSSQTGSLSGTAGFFSF